MLVVRGRALAEEVIVFRHHDVLVEPADLIEQCLICVENRFDINVFQALVESVLQKLVDLFSGEELQFALTENPIKDSHLCFICFPAGCLNIVLKLFSEKIGVLLADRIDKFLSKQAVNLLFLTGRLDSI